MTEDIVILDVEGSEILIFEGSDPPDVIDGQEEVFIVSVGEQGPRGPAGEAVAGGTAAQVLTIAGDGVTRVWADPAVSGATPADIANVMAFAAING